MPIISIYSITHRESGKRYIGKSVDTSARWAAHRSSMRNPIFDRKKVNRHLWKDAQKFGLDAFAFETVEVFEAVDEALLADREIFWMDHFNTCCRSCGYNLRRDSSSVSSVHPETAEIFRQMYTGAGNPNYGKKWTDQQKAAMRDSRIARADRYQTDSYKRKQSEASSRRWKDKVALKEMSEKVRKSLLQYNFLQMDESFRIIRVWPDMRSLVQETGFKKQCIYAVCDGYKERYRGYRWAKIRREVFDAIFAVAP